MTTHKFPKLYKLTATGATQFWQIEVKGTTLTETWGQVGGKEQSTSDTIREGKNTGRANATTAAEQTKSEAQSKWEGKIKKGYVEHLDRAEAGETDHAGGTTPMLAHTFAKQGHKLTYPCFAQPKLDGCLDGKTQITTDVGVLFLKDIVENKIQCKVLSYNSEGYEGAIARNMAGQYEGKRSSNLIKVKEFDDSEFEIDHIEEGRGKLQGHVGAFVCITKSGKEFKAKMKGDTAQLKVYFDNPRTWQGRLLTVQYQGLSAYGIPRFPIGLRFREKE